MPAVPIELNSYVAEKRVEGPLLERLSTLDPQSLTAVRRLIEVTNPSANTLRLTLRTADEIAKRDRSSTAAVLLSNDVQQILDAEGFSRKEKQKLLRTHLERLRYPVFGEIRDRLQSMQKELMERFGIKLEFPDDLEGDQVRIELQARSPEEIAEFGQRLLQLADDAECADFYTVLKGGL